MKKTGLLIVFFIMISIGNYSQNTKRKWGYFLQIVDNNYIPQIKNIDSAGYITLHTGITDYDAVFAKYKITEFYQYAPTSATEWIRQTYCLVCDSGQIDLGCELNSKYSNIIPFIEIFYMTPNLTKIDLSKISKDNDIIFQSNGTIKLTGFTGQTIRINLYDLKGKLLCTKTTDSDVINCKENLSKGTFLYKIIIGSINETGLLIII